MHYFSIDQKKPLPSVVNFLVGRQFVAVVAKLSLKQQSVIDINLKLFSKELLFNMSNLENMTVSLI